MEGESCQIKTESHPPILYISLFLKQRPLFPLFLFFVVLRYRVINFGINIPFSRKMKMKMKITAESKACLDWPHLQEGGLGAAG